MFKNMKKGILYIISAPSGTGKSSLIQALLKNKFFINIKYSISYTTRKKRLNEINKVNYFFVTKDKFKRMIESDCFIEYSYIFGDYYGTSKFLVEKNINSGVDLILDIDWKGTEQIKKKISSVCAIFILPPSKKELLRRLIHRGVDKKEVIRYRMKQAEIEIKNYINYDYIIINDNFTSALKNLKSIIRNRCLCFKYPDNKFYDLVKKFLST